jgi:hypothetical protein
MAKFMDQAIGSWEAASVAGVHWTQPAVMAKKGLITSRPIKSPTATGTDRIFGLYSLAQIDADYHDYEDAKTTGTRRGGSRSCLHLRPAALKKLAALPVKIAFDDAVGAGEAATIMGCHWTWPPRLARAGKIEGRVVHNGRAGTASDRLWIFSRKSCERNASETKQLLRAGAKVGRPRRSLKNK